MRIAFVAPYPPVRCGIGDYTAELRKAAARVEPARVDVDGEVVSSIGHGLLVLLGAGRGDSEQDVSTLTDKIANLRIFEDAEGKMNLSLRDTGGELLVVSQFTLAGNCSKGRRPSFDNAAPPGEANRLYDYFVARARGLGITVATGVFQAMMEVELVNDGPVTFILESRNAPFAQSLR